MSAVYSEIMWLGAVVIVLAIAALVGLWRREDPGALEPVKPLILSQAERDLLLHEKIAAFQKMQAAKAASKKARRDRRRQRATGKTDPTS